MRTKRIKDANSRLYRHPALSVVEGLGQRNMMRIKHANSWGILGLIGWIGFLPRPWWEASGRRTH